MQYRASLKQSLMMMYASSPIIGSQDKYDLFLSIASVLERAEKLLNVTIDIHEAWHVAFSAYQYFLQINNFATTKIIAQEIDPEKELKLQLFYAHSKYNQIIESIHPEEHNVSSDMYLFQASENTFINGKNYQDLNCKIEITPCIFASSSCAPNKFKSRDTFPNAVEQFIEFYPRELITQTQSLVRLDSINLSNSYDLLFFKNTYSNPNVVFHWGFLERGHYIEKLNKYRSSEY